ncbi:hypothetical protein [Kitasatospora sp. NPDC050543]|uniref:hypothetical protein n=1 Tax=Kitasatospora sp. NPDC050543 TaxID=3364054 RepID=UPI0037BCEB9A
MNRFAIRAFNAKGCVLRLAPGAEGADHLEVASAREARKVTKTVKSGRRYDFDTERYIVNRIAKFELFQVNADGSWHPTPETVERPAKEVAKVQTGAATATEKAKTAALQAVVAAREAGRAITREFVDVILSRDAGTVWGDANVRTVRMWVRKLAILSTDVVALTDREEYWTYRARFYNMTGDELATLGEQIYEDQTDPRGWNKNFVNALSNARSFRGMNRVARRRLAA